MAELTDEELTQWREDRAAQAAGLARLLERVEAMEKLPKGTTATEIETALAAIRTELAALKTEAPDRTAREQIAALQAQLKELAALPPSSKEKEDGPPAPPPNPAPPEKPEVKPTRADKHGWL